MLFSDYPRVIEPTTNLLEMKVAPGNGAQQPSSAVWSVLRRHIPDAGFIYPRGCSHLFGPPVPWREVPYLLGYDVTGVMRYFFARDADGELRFEPVPEETIGAPLLHPSVRLSFNTPEERDRFVDHVLKMEYLGTVALARRPISLDVAETQ